MSRIRGFLTMACLAFLVLPASAQAPKPKDLVWTHAFDLACRKLGEAEFSDKTKKFGVEAFKDLNNNLGLIISQTGSIAVTGNFEKLQAAIKESQGPEWNTGLDLPARKAGEKEFTKDTQVHCLEIFRDPNTDNWMHITDKGVIAAAVAKSRAGGNKTPRWSHSFDVMVRPGTKEWKDAAKVGIEVYKDPSTSSLIYIANTGHIATVPEAGDAKPADEAKAPVWLHGLDLACRKHDEPSFSKDTKRFGVEVFRDENTGNLVFITETGSLAVTPGKAGLDAPTKNIKEPKWTHGLNVRCRSFGEKEFSDKTAVFGAEVFRDENVGVVLYISEKGNLAAIAK